jgi:hypothetical protein
MNDDNIMACILFARLEDLIAADDAATDYAQLRAAVGRLEGERQALRAQFQERVQSSISLDELTALVEEWRTEAGGHYCRTYNRGKAEGLEEAANELEAAILIKGFDAAAALAADERGAG